MSAENNYLEGKAMTDFDIQRAILRDEDSYEPFRVSSTERLDDVVAKWRVQRKSPLLVMTTKQGTLVLLTHQMCYHHIAQGELAREPWLISF